MSDLMLLFENRLDLIIQENFLPIEKISTFIEVLERQAEWQASKIDIIENRVFADLPVPPHLFKSQYSAIAKSATEKSFCEESQKYHEIWKRICDACGFDLFKFFAGHLQKNFRIDLQLAKYDGLPYSPVSMRDLSDGGLAHADFGPLDGPGWAISSVISQLAWNIYLTQPTSGGKTTIYDYIWDDSVQIDESTYGFENLDKPIKAEFQPICGRLVLFNSRNFHAIAPSVGPRITIGGFVGLTRDGEILAWS